MTNHLVYKCEQCNYVTLVKGNYKGHMIAKHSDKLPEYKCDYCDSTFRYSTNRTRHIVGGYCKGLISPPNVAVVHPNVAVIPPNVAVIPPNVAVIPPNVAVIPPNVAVIPPNVAVIPPNVAVIPPNVAQGCPLTGTTVCYRCHKDFTRTDSLRKHYLICTGTKDPLECHICHLILPSRYSKCRHLKTCKPVTSTELIPAPSNPEQGGQIVTNNNIQNNNIQNNNIQNNVQNNVQEQNNIQQINIITFSGDSNSRLNLSTEHITQAMMDDLFTRAKHYNHYKMNTDILAGFCDYLLEAIVNRCVRKTNARANYSQVHKGNNRWIQCHDSEVYDKFLTETTERFIEFIHCSKIKLKAAPFVIKKLDDFLNYMAEEGLCCEDRDTNLKVLKCYSKLIERLKSKIVQLTKSDE